MWFKTPPRWSKYRRPSILRVPLGQNQLMCAKLRGTSWRQSVCCEMHSLQADVCSPRCVKHLWIKWQKAIVVQECSRLFFRIIRTFFFTSCGGSSSHSEFSLTHCTGQVAFLHSKFESMRFSDSVKIHWIPVNIVFTTELFQWFYIDWHSVNFDWITEILTDS